jgi:aryl-alcohol dehydrogenase-like predicted oxidoreductase
MEYRKLGRSDLNVSRIGFGTMSLELTNPLTKNILLRALDGGINYFDTADLYHHGMNETFIGVAFRGLRHRVILATKGGNQWRADGSGWDWNPSKKYILNCIDQSLGRLQTDYVDLYQLHGGTLDDPIDEIIETFESLQAAGKIRYYGISSIRPNVIREYVKRSSIVSVMMQYSLLDRRPEEEMLQYLLENNVAVLARGSIAKGLLVSKPATSYLNYSAGDVEKAAKAVRSVSDKFHSPFESAIGFVKQHPAVSSAVLGIRTEEQLADAILAGRFQKFNENKMEILRNALPANQYTDHR